MFAHAAAAPAGALLRASRPAPLALAALGVVYGDIGTSPLYALRESFEGGGHDLAVSRGNVLGILSLIVWSLLLVITVKYLVFVMRADNDGEGGILALTSLLPPSNGGRTGAARRRRAMVLVGLFGTALLYGDGMITPAISVLSAVEGTAVAFPRLAGHAVPVATAILVALFAAQRWGTAGLGRVFGPVMAVWFGVLAVLGVAHIAAEPGVLAALNPAHAVAFFAANGLTGVLALGSVVLVVTGGEALYADMGHFGRRPIARAWVRFVLPSLLLNYLGQGALLLADPSAIDHPLYRMVPGWGTLPLLVLATAATVIASQALISGAFSLTMQASQVGYLPRVRVLHTSARERGQIYVPAVNRALMVACVGLVVGFGTSRNLAAAYGLAVTMTMVITTLLYFLVLRTRFGWSLPAAAGLCGAFLLVDGAFLAASAPKVPHGGWFPLVVGGAVFTLLTTWFTGRRIVRERARRGMTPLRPFLDSVLQQAPPRVEGTAVYLFGSSDMAPAPLLSNFRCNHVLHERVLAVNVVTDRVPRRLRVERVRRRDLGHGIAQVDLHYGFMEQPHVARDLCDHLGVDPRHTTYVLGREQVVVTNRPGMARWREHLFAWMRRNATSAAAYFDLPPERVIEIATQVEL